MCILVPTGPQFCRPVTEVAAAPSSGVAGSPACSLGARELFWGAQGQHGLEFADTGSCRAGIIFLGAPGGCTPPPTQTWGTQGSTPHTHQEPGYYMPSVEILYQLWVAPLRPPHSYADECSWSQGPVRAAGGSKSFSLSGRGDLLLASGHWLSAAMSRGLGNEMGASSLGSARDGSSGRHLAATGTSCLG